MKKTTKICTKCKTEKLLGRFCKSKKGRFGVKSVCKKCEKTYRDESKKEIAIRDKAYRELHKDKAAIYHKTYRQSHKEKLSITSKEYRKLHKEKAATYGKIYYETNKETIRAKHIAYYQANKETINSKQTQSRRASLKRNLANNVSTAIRISLKGNKNGRGWESLVGYTLAALRSHLEKQFTDGMSWEKYGEWHVDHKIPISVFNFTKPEHEDFKRCWALSNLQPMRGSENCSKGAKLTNHFQPSLLIG